MNPLEQAYSKVKESWNNQINSLYMDADPSHLEDILDTIRKDQEAFQQLSKYKPLFIEEEKVVELIEEDPVEEPVVEEVVEEVSPSFRIERKLRGADAILIGSESTKGQAISYYLSEVICIKKKLFTGTIVKGQVSEGRLIIDEVTLPTGPESDPNRRTYEKCLVSIDKGGQMYSNRYFNNNFIKDDRENFIRLNISEKDKNHFYLQEGDVIDIAENTQTNLRIVSLKLQPYVSGDTIKTEPKKKDRNVKTPAEKREDLFRPLPATPEIVMARSVAIFAPERLHQRFIDTLEILCGMRVRMVGEGSKESEVFSAIKECEFFLIAGGHTDGSYYKRMRNACTESETRFKSLVHAGVNETLRNIVEMILTEDPLSI